MSPAYFHRALERRIDLAPRTKAKVVLLFGARQTGKTTLLRRLAGVSSARFVNLQDRRLRRRYESELGLLERELGAQPEVRLVVIDEVQKVPALLDDVQFLYDRDPGRWQFVLTGSSARQLRRSGANLLPGRSVSFTLSPVLQAECRPCQIVPVDPPEEPHFPGRALEDCLLHGSLPGLFTESRESWVDTLATYADLYIENEIRQESIVRDMGAFSRFLELAAIESGRIVNYTKMASAVGVAVNTLRTFYQVLEDTFVGVRVPPFPDRRRRLLGRDVAHGIGRRGRCGGQHPRRADTRGGQVDGEPATLRRTPSGDLPGSSSAGQEGVRRLPHSRPPGPERACHGPALDRVLTASG